MPSWWVGVTRRIAECDVFVVIIFHHSLDSVTCRRELQWATALDQPVLPIAIEQPPDELPPGIATRQVIDYFEPGSGAACAVDSRLAALPSVPPPGQWPEPPPAPPALDEEPAAAAEWNSPLEFVVIPTRRRGIDELLDSAVRAINRGDRAAADALANRVLEVDRGNFEAEELLAAPAGSGEIRRMTICSRTWWIPRRCPCEWSRRSTALSSAGTATRSGKRSSAMTAT